jgi:ABC-type polar amino acid transport system ATPase subunit
MRPVVLLFDEATSALDPELVGEVLTFMEDLAKDGRHDHGRGDARYELAQDAADEIVFLDHGRVVEVSTPEKFFRQAETERARQFLQRYGSLTQRSTRAREETAT